MQSDDTASGAGSNVDLHGTGRSSTRLNRSHIGGAPSQVFPSNNNSENSTKYDEDGPRINRDARRYETHFSLGGDDQTLPSTKLAEDTDAQIGRGKKHAPELTNRSSIAITSNGALGTTEEEMMSPARRDRNASHLQQIVGGLAGASLDDTDAVSGFAADDATPKEEKKDRPSNETTYDEDRAIGKSGKAIKPGKHNQSHFQLGGGMTDDGPIRPSSRYPLFFSDIHYMI